MYQNSSCVYILVLHIYLLLGSEAKIYEKQFPYLKVSVSMSVIINFNGDYH